MAAARSGGSLMVFLALLGVGAYTNQDAPLSTTTSAKVYAVCLMARSPNAPYNVSGTVDFMQSVTSLNYPLGQLKVSLRLQGFPTNDDIVDHGLHVHMYGDLTNGCDSAGGHYNPRNSVHGDRTSPVRHVGDFGNVLENSQGRIVSRFSDKTASLVGDHSIIGRALVVHEKADDLGLGGNEASLANGNSGFRVACCVIAFANGSNWSRV